LNRLLCSSESTGAAQKSKESPSQRKGRKSFACAKKTPRHDYDGCLQIIVNLVNRIERKTGQNCPVGIGIPGSLEPKSRLGKGASSTWLLGRPVERDLQTALGRVMGWVTRRE
jgi:fructokinase